MYINSFYNKQEYKVQEIPGFLSSEECDIIIQLAKPKLDVSKVYHLTSDKLDISHRKSKQAWLEDSEHQIVKKISDLTVGLVGYPIDHFEKLQVVKYETGGFFNPHYDPCVGNPEHCRRMNGSAGQRLFTLLIYLNDEFTGGETIFPLINVKVKPEKGKAVLFRNVDIQTAKVIKQSFHSGNVIGNGVKWVCNKWVREKPF